jgi:hypothetical protein
MNPNNRFPPFTGVPETDLNNASLICLECSDSSNQQIVKIPLVLQVLENTSSREGPFERRIYTSY